MMMMTQLNTESVMLLTRLFQLNKFILSFLFTPVLHRHVWCPTFFRTPPCFTSALIYNTTLMLLVSPTCCPLS